MIRLLSFSLLLSLALVHESRAVVAVDNTGLPPDGAGGVGSISTGNTFARAASFFTGTDNLQLQQVALFLDSGSEFDPSPVNFTLELRADDAGPGGLLTTFTGPSDRTSGIPDDSGGVVNFSGSYLLASHTNYWLVASAPGNTDSAAFFWHLTNSPGETDLPGWNAGPGHNYSVNGGAWTSYPEQLQFRVETVPEPESLVLLFAGMGCMLGNRRR